MKYHVIANSNNPVAVVFHDYVAAQFVVHSRSEAFRRAFEAAVATNSSLTFQKRGQKLKFNQFGPQYPSWVDRILSKICDNFWTVQKTGNVTGEAFIDDIAAEYLPSIQ